MIISAIKQTFQTAQVIAYDQSQGVSPLIQTVVYNIYPTVHVVSGYM